MAIFVGFMFAFCLFFGVVTILIVLIGAVINKDDNVADIVKVLSVITVTLALTLIALNKAENNERRYITATQVDAVE